ncbi:hypothetical protein [Sulfitobacter sp. MF3-043]|uniref:hypothetical protein n=1 Tax=Sulfitobacter sediminivivens TaxID=3252902 RepID=UPI0036DA026C
MSGLGPILSILMVGHSLFGSAGPDMLQAALSEGQGQGRVQAQIINGAPLRYNWEQSANAEGVDARALLPEGGISHLILTEAVPLANHTRWSDTEVYAQAFFGLAVSANPATKVYLQETWHSRNSGTGVAVDDDAQAHVPWRARLDQDLPVWQGIVTSVAAGNRTETASITLIPAGQAMARLYDEIAADRVPGISDIGALFADDIHLNDLGHYFVAMVQYASLTGESPQGLTNAFNDRWGKSFDAPGPVLARNLQRIAWDAVRGYDGAVVAPQPSEAPARAASAPGAPTGPPANILQVPEGAAPGSGNVGIGLASIADWSTQQPFIDVMKTARSWLGHRPGAYGGMEYAELVAGGYLNPDGWPVRMPPDLSSIGTLILTDMPEAAVSLEGRYLLRFDGTGVIEVAGRAQNVRYGAGEVTFDYTPGPGSVDIRVQRINTTDPPRNISVIKLDNAARLDQGATFNPAWSARIGGFRVLRFMDWMQTNNATVSTWADRPEPGDVSFASGVPVEVMVALANELETDAWFNMPHLADDDYVRRFATYVRDNLDPKLTTYVEFSNEVWNWQFDQAVWADVQSLARWDQKDKWMQYYGLRAAEVARIWSDVFGDQGDARLVNLISSQTGWLGLETEALDAPLVQAEGLAAPADAFDAYAVTGYFGGILGVDDRQPVVKDWLDESRTRARAAAKTKGLSGATAQEYVALHRFDHATALAGRDLYDGAVSDDVNDTVADLIGRVWPYHAAVARARGLDLIVYEGGSHVVGLGAQVDDADLTAFFQHINYSTEMGTLYATLLAGWQAIGGQLFVAYSDVYAPTKWGSWGGLRHLDDENPRWDALVAVQ